MVREKRTMPRVFDAFWRTLLIIKHQISHKQHPVLASRTIRNHFPNGPLNCSMLKYDSYQTHSNGALSFGSFAFELNVGVILKRKKNGVKSIQLTWSTFNFSAHKINSFFIFLHKKINWIWKMMETHKKCAWNPSKEW